MCCGCEVWEADGSQPSWLQALQLLHLQEKGFAFSWLRAQRSSDSPSRPSSLEQQSPAESPACLLSGPLLPAKPE